MSICKNAVQTFLLQGGTVQELQEKFALEFKRGITFPNLVLFKYNIKDSPMSEPIVQHARGVILDEADNWRVISWPLNKFFNHLEGHAANIDWSSARVQEKLDGSLCQLYHYQNAFRVASSGSPEASGRVNYSDILFREYFWQTLAQYPKLNEIIRNNEPDTNMTYLFELMGPLNRVVVVHSEPKLVLLGSRNRNTGQEYTAHQTNNLFLQGSADEVQEYPLTSLEEIVETFNTMSPLSQEGYVIVDKDFNRIKVKHPGYVALHHAKDGMTTKAFVEIVRKGEVSEVLSAFPEFRPLIEEAQRRYDILLTQVTADYQRLQHISVQKDFALEAVKTPYPSVLFLVRAGEVANVSQGLQQMRIDTLLTLLGYKIQDDHRESTITNYDENTMINYRIVVKNILNRPNAIIALKQWWDCSLMEARDKLNYLLQLHQNALTKLEECLFYLPTKGGELELDFSEHEEITALFRQYNNPVDYTVISQPSESSQRQREQQQLTENDAEYLAALRWQQSLSIEDRKKIDLLINRYVP